MKEFDLKSYVTEIIADYLELHTTMWDFEAHGEAEVLAPEGVDEMEKALDVYLEYILSEALEARGEE